MNSTSLKTGLFGYIIGISLFFFFLIIAPFWCFILLGTISVFIFLLQKHKYLKLILIFLFCFVISSLRIHYNQHVVNSQNIDFYNDTEVPVALEGYICNEPDLRADKAKYTICTQKVLLNQSNQDVSGKILITTKRYPEYQYGEKFKIYGRLKTPAIFETFSYRDYLSRYNVFSVMYSPKIEKIGKGAGNAFFAKTYEWKKSLENKINQIFPEPNSSFLAGLLVGSRRGISEEVMENFNIAGLTHIIAISGYNITIVIVFIMGLLKFLPRKIGFYLTIVGVIFFTIFVGASAAVVRAAIMGILGLIALNKGRQTDTTLVILITATLMITYNPKILWYDVGFQLSFLAVLGLIYVAPFFEKWFEKIPKTLGLREALMMTLSAQITAVPIILLNFERLSLIAPLANILAAPFIPLAMLFGFIAILVSFISFKLSLLIGFFAYICLEITLKSAECLAKMPWASVGIKNLSVFVVIGYYLLLIGWIYWKNQTKKFSINL